MRDKYNERLLINTWADEDIEIKREQALKEGFKAALMVGLAIGLILLVLMGSTIMAHADNNKIVVKSSDYVAGYHVQRWADAIFWAENSKSHPYGVMETYKNTTSRQACINTLKHRWKDYCAIKLPRIGFLAYLQASYAPDGASNDPCGLNSNWQNNVLYYLNNPKKVEVRDNDWEG